jgi:hypothetical protein
MRKPEGPSLRCRRGVFHVRFRRNGKRYEVSLQTREQAEALRRVAQFAALGEAFHVRLKGVLSDGAVYFIGSDCGRIKIGWSRDPEQRLRQLDQRGPRALTLLAVVPGMSKATELALHERLSASRVVGKREWYEPSLTIRKLIEAAVAGKPLPSDTIRRPRGPRKLRGKLPTLKENWKSL